MIVSLDAEAVSALAGPDGARKRRVRRALEAAARTKSDVIVPALVLAELYRGVGRMQLVDALLARHERSLGVRDTDRVLARLVGAVLNGAGLGSTHIVDAHVVAVAVEAGGGVALTADEADLMRLAAPYRSVLVEPLG
jgi:predicted nucleic acid-binding protein